MKPGVEKRVEGAGAAVGGGVEEGVVVLLAAAELVVVGTGAAVAVAAEAKAGTATPTGRTPNWLNREGGWGGKADDTAPPLSPLGPAPSSPYPLSHALAPPLPPAPPNL